MAGSKSKKSRKSAVRRPAATAGIFATATAVGLMASAGNASAAAPDYADDVSKFSHSIDNVVSGLTHTTDAFNRFWAPLAANANGVLPTFSASNEKVDMTDISEFPSVVRAIARVPMPTALPGVVPQINIPGQGFETLPVPTSLPGADLLVGFADGLDAVFNVPGVDWIVGSIPPLSELVPGLEATQQTFHSGFGVPLLGIGGSTSVSNTYVQTPPGSPSITADLPVAQGVYTFPLDAAMGWWAAAPTLAVSDGISQNDFVISLPTAAAGLEVPGGLGQAGVFSVAAVLPSASGLYIPVGATISNASIPSLGFGLTTLNVSSGNYVGTDGVNLNNGQNILVIQNALTGAVPIPIIYSLGGFNLGPEGIGYTAPSLYGISPISPIQIGTASTGRDAVGIIPADLIPVGDILPTQLVSVSGLVSGLLGFEDPSAAIGSGLAPIYSAVVTPGAQQLSNLLAQEYGSIVDSLASSVLQASQDFKNLTDRIAARSATSLPSLQTESVSVVLDEEPVAKRVAPASAALTSTQTAPVAITPQEAASQDVASATAAPTTTSGASNKVDPVPSDSPEKPEKPVSAKASLGGTKTPSRERTKAAVQGAVKSITTKVKDIAKVSGQGKKSASAKKPTSSSSSGSAGSSGGSAD